MTHRSRIRNVVAAMLILGSFPAMAQAPAQNSAARTYECAANAHCNIYCVVDGEKLMQFVARRMQRGE